LKRAKAERSVAKAEKLFKVAKLKKLKNLTAKERSDF
jgi:hypothetical protein